MKVYKLYLVQYYYLGKRYYKCGLTTKGDVMDRFKYDILNSMKNDDHFVIDVKNETVDNICEECRKEDESVKQNLIMYSYKICNGCNLAKKIFPL